MYRVNITSNGKTVLRHSLDATPQRETTCGSKLTHREYVRQQAKIKALYPKKIIHG